MALVMVAGVGQPVGVFGLAGILVIAPFVISSASSTGVRRVFSAVGPAPETPGTVESMVLARIPIKSGLSALFKPWGETNSILIIPWEPSGPRLYLNYQGVFNHQGIPGAEYFLVSKKMLVPAWRPIALYNYRRENYYDNV